MYCGLSFFQKEEVALFSIPGMAGTTTNSNLWYEACLRAVDLGESRGAFRCRQAA
jgi:hypothetical protein